MLQGCNDNLIHGLIRRAHSFLTELMCVAGFFYQTVKKNTTKLFETKCAPFAEMWKRASLNGGSAQANRITKSLDDSLCWNI